MTPSGDSPCRTAVNTNSTGLISIVEAVGYMVSILPLTGREGKVGNHVAATHGYPYRCDKAIA